MKQVLPILLISCLLNACARLINGPTTSVRIYAIEPPRIRVNNDTVQGLHTHTTVVVPRSSDTLTIWMLTDSLPKKITIAPRTSLAYYSNILFNLGAGMLVEKNHPRRYGYPKNIYLDTAGNPTGFQEYNLGFRESARPFKKGRVDLRLSLPYVNSFHLTPDNESSKSNTGFWGLSAGLDYYHRYNQFLSIAGSGATDFFVPLPAAVDISGEYELMSTVYLALTNNHRLQKFILGYGLCFSRNTWNLKYYPTFNPPPPTRDPVKKTADAIGFVFPVQYQLGNDCFAGLIYRPTILRLSKGVSLGYEHLISLEVGWKISLGK